MCLRSKSYFIYQYMSFNSVQILHDSDHLTLSLFNYLPYRKKILFSDTIRNYVNKGQTG